MTGVLVFKQKERNQKIEEAKGTVIFDCSGLNRQESIDLLMIEIESHIGSSIDGMMEDSDVLKFNWDISRK